MSFVSNDVTMPVLFNMLFVWFFGTSMTLVLILSSISALPMLFNSSIVDRLIILLKERSCSNETAEAYNPRLNKYDDTSINECPAIPYVCCSAEVDNDNPTIVSPIALLPK
jgi:hypothetical protein